MIPIKLVETEPIHITLVTPQPIPFQLSAAIIKKEVAEEYEGVYDFTPSAETQTIPINGKTATQDITINPIPQNYGLITWNGATLTVS